MSGNGTLATNELLTFSIGEELFGIEITSVREILTYPTMTTMPNMPIWMKGIMNLRGEVTPIIDLRIKFNSTQAPEYKEDTIVIAIVLPNGRMLGLVVDSVSDIESISNEQRLSPPIMENAEQSKMVKGLVEKDDKLIMIVNITKILSGEENRVLDAANNSEVA